MLALVIKDKDRKQRVQFFTTQKALEKRLSKVWRKNRRVLVLKLAEIKKLKAIAVEGLWVTKSN